LISVLITIIHIFAIVFCCPRPEYIIEDNKKGSNMKIIISGHHVEITEGINQSVENKFAKVAKHFPSLMTLDVIITVEPSQQKLEVSTTYEGATVSVNAADKELYAAIASAASKLEAALAHRKGVLSAKQKKKYEVEQSNAFESS
jgi:putative sigma-54 modulation protein